MYPNPSKLTQMLKPMKTHSFPLDMIYEHVGFSMNLQYDTAFVYEKQKKILQQVRPVRGAVVHMGGGVGG